MRLTKESENSIRVVLGKGFEPAEAARIIVDKIFPENEDNQQPDGSPQDEPNLNDPKLNREDPEYLRGFYFGKLYAEYMFNHHGVKPDIEYEIPDIDVSIIKALHESASTYDVRNKEDYIKAINQMIVTSMNNEEAYQKIVDYINQIFKDYEPEPQSGGAQNGPSPFELNNPPQQQQNNQGSQNNQGGQQNQQNQQNQQGQQGGQNQQGQQGGQSQQGGSDDANQGQKGGSDSSDGSQSDSENSGGSSGEGKGDGDKSGEDSSSSNKGGDSNGENGENGGKDGENSNSNNGGSDSSDEIEPGSGKGNDSNGSDSEGNGGESGNDSGSDGGNDTGSSNQNGGGSGSSGSQKMTAEEYEDTLEKAESEYGGSDKVAMRNTGDKSGKFSDKVLTDEEAKEILDELNAETNAKDDYGVEGNDNDVLNALKATGAQMRSNERANVPAANEGIKESNENMIASLKEAVDSDIDWKGELQDYISSYSTNKEYRHFNKNVASRSGLYMKNSYRTKDSLKKCLVYLDTSGSAIGFVISMLKEVSELLMQNNFQSVDFHLFADSVYDRDRYIDMSPEDAYDIFNDNGVKIRSGGTSPDAVYKHIYKNYTDRGELDGEIDFIIILSDHSGITGTGDSIEADGLNPSCTEKMFYLIYDDSYSMTMSEVKEDVRNSIAADSKFMVVNKLRIQNSLDDDDSSDVNESRVENLDNYDLDDEIQAGRISVDDIEYFKKHDSLSDEEKKKSSRLADLAFARRTGKYEEVFGEIINVMKERFPNVSPVESEFKCENDENTYFITDDETIILHTDIKDSKFVDLLYVCSKYIVDKIIGNISVDDCDTVEEFPDGFPKVIDGDFEVEFLPKLLNDKNFPTTVTGNVDLGFLSNKIPLSRVKQIENRLRNGKNIEFGRISVFN